MGTPGRDEMMTQRKKDTSKQTQEILVIGELKSPPAFRKRERSCDSRYPAAP